MGRASHTHTSLNPLPTPLLTPHPSPLQLVGKLPVITLIYSSAIPICYALCALMMWMSMWIDRWNLLRMVVPPPRSPPWLISLMLCKILPGAPCRTPDTLPRPTAHRPLTAPPSPPRPGALLAHLGTGVMFYTFQLGVMRGDDECAPDSCLDDSNLHHCHTPAQLAEAETAVSIMWAALWVWGACTIYFFVRELRRKEATAVHIVDGGAGGGGQAAAVFGDAVELISAAAGSVEWENRVLREERATPFRRQAGLTLYMPPLPNSIISKLHTVSADTNTFKAGLEPGEARLRRSDWRSSRDDRAWASPNALV